MAPNGELHFFGGVEVGVAEADLVSFQLRKFARAGPDDPAAIAVDLLRKVENSFPADQHGGIGRRHAAFHQPGRFERFANGREHFRRLERF